jgi:hypothetical protein
MRGSLRSPPRKEFHNQLRRPVEAGFEKRVLFRSGTGFPVKGAV